MYAVTICTSKLIRIVSCHNMVDGEEEEEEGVMVMMVVVEEEVVQR